MIFAHAAKVWSVGILLRKSLLRRGKSPDSLGFGLLGAFGNDGRAIGAGEAVLRL
jgi:hypothetical protein